MWYSASAQFLGLLSGTHRWWTFSRCFHTLSMRVNACRMGDPPRRWFSVCIWTRNHNIMSRWRISALLSKDINVFGRLPRKVSIELFTELITFLMISSWQSTPCHDSQLWFLSMPSMSCSKKQDSRSWYRIWRTTSWEISTCGQLQLKLECFTCEGLHLWKRFRSQISCCRTFTVRGI